MVLVFKETENKNGSIFFFLSVMIVKGSGLYEPFWITHTLELLLLALKKNNKKTNEVIEEEVKF